MFHDIAAMIITPLPDADACLMPLSERRHAIFIFASAMLTLDDVSLIDTYADDIFRHYYRDVTMLLLRYASVIYGM